MEWKPMAALRPWANRIMCRKVTPYVDETPRTDLLKTR
jgi:hypothetical protein